MDTSGKSVKQWANDEVNRHLDMAREFLGLKSRDAHAELPGVVRHPKAAEVRRKQGPGFHQAEIE